MQASVPGELRWRLSLYQRSFELCAAGGFSLARLLALVPDRLRLAEGDAGARIRIPVGAAPSLQEKLRRSLPGGEAPELAAPPAGRGALVRWLRLAQAHPEVDPLALLAWLEAGADELLDTLTRCHRKALAEVGRGEGGLETAYLAHLALGAALSGALAARAATPATRAVVAEVASAAWAEVAAALPEGREVPARLALQTSLTGGLIALGAEAEGWVELPVNPRRTLPDALRLARRVLQPPLETLPLERAVQSVARRLLAEPRLAQALLTDLLHEQARDAALLLVARLHRPGHPERAEPAAALARAPRALTRALFHHGARRELLAWLATPEVAAERAAGALARLLEGAEAVAGGDPGPLGVHGDLQGRATLAAQGALLTALDEHTHALVADVTGLIAWLPPAAVEARHAEGRAYRLAADGAPIFLLPDEATEAVALVEWAGVFGAEWPPARRAAAFVARHLAEPLAAAAARHPGVRSVSLGATHAAFRGPPAEAVAFAQDALQIGRAAVAARLGAAPDVLGGTSEVAELRAAEAARLSRRIESLEEALERAQDDPAALRMLLDSRALLVRQRGLLTGTSSGGEGAPEDAADVAPVVSVAVTFGEAAEGAPLAGHRRSSPCDPRSDFSWNGPTKREHIWPYATDERRSRSGCSTEDEPAQRVGDFSEGLLVSRPLVEAWPLVARVPWVAAQRLGRWALAREARGAPGLRLPFAVAVRTREGQPALFNGGCVLTDAAREALEGARAGTTVEALTLELRLLQDDLRARYVFDHDPEALRIVRGADGRVLFVLRRAGALGQGPEGEAPPLWELLPADLELLADLLGPGGAR
jgi:hypothetical protein